MTWHLCRRPQTDDHALQNGSHRIYRGARAISAFGVGGTNAHVILEEPPAQTSGDSARPAQLLVLSARSEQAIEKGDRQSR